MRKLGVLLITIIMLASFSLPAFANTNLKIDKPNAICSNIMALDFSKANTAQINNIKNQISSLSNKEFDDFIVTYLTKEKDFTKIENNLSKVDVEIQAPKKTPLMSIQTLQAWQLNLSITGAKRGGESFYRLISYYTPSTSEPFPASYDGVIISWNKDKASYYLTNTSNSYYNSLKDYNAYTQGTIVFNSYDTNFTSSTGSQYVAVYVTPIVGTGTLDFGTQYQHSYTTVTFSGSLNPTIQYSGPGLVTGSVGATINWSTSESVWVKAATNAISW